MSETVLDRLVALPDGGAGVQRERAGRARSRCCGPTRARSGQPVDRPDQRAPAGRDARRLRPERRAGPGVLGPLRRRRHGRRRASRRAADRVPAGVARSELRAVDTCPPELAPIAELQYRSQWFSHPNGRDWTVRALLVARRAWPRAHVADDAETSAALLLALDRLLDEPVDRLAKQLLDADFFRDLVNPDPVRSLLGWLDDPQGFRARLDDAQWTAFVQQCKADYGFDPTRRRRDHRRAQARRARGRVGAGLEALRRDARALSRDPRAAPQGAADGAHRRAPRRLAAGQRGGRGPAPQPPARLRGADRRRRPQGGRAASTPSTRGGAARSGPSSDQAPLAFALEQLARARRADRAAARRRRSRRRSSADYADRGWRADDAVLRALAAAHERRPIAQAVSAAVAAMYRPWLDAGAKALQAAIGPMANAHTYAAGPPASTAHGTRHACSSTGCGSMSPTACRSGLTASGLDVAADDEPRRAADRHPDREAGARSRRRRERSAAGPDLHAANAATGTKASIQVLRSLMAENGVQVLGPDGDGRPVRHGVDGGRRDRPPRPRRRHPARRLPRRGGRADRRAASASCSTPAGSGSTSSPTTAGSCSRAAWRRSSCPPATTEVKKGRCARLKDGAAVEVPTVPWFWDPGRADRPRARASPASRRTRSTSTAASARRSASCRGSSVTAGAAVDDDRRPGDHQGQVAGAALPDRVHRRCRRGRRRPPRAPGRPEDEHRRGGEGDDAAPARCRSSCPTRTTRASAPTSCSSPPTAQILAQREVDRREEPMSELDELDQLAAEVFEGYLVRKDLAQQFRGQYPVPTYVGEFLLGRYCATTDPDEIAEGLAIVERSMKERTVRAGEEELFKSRAREKGRVKIIDLLRARLDAKSDAYKAELPSLQLNDIHISDELVNEHDRMLTGGFYAEVTLEYIAALGKESGRPAVPGRVGAADPDVDPRRARHVRRRARAASRSSSGATCCCAASASSPTGSRARQQDVLLARMVPFVVTQLQRRRARAARHRQVAPVPADLALRPPRLGRQGDDRQHVRQQRAPAGAGSSPSTTSSASTRSPASRSTRRKASTSSRATWSPASSAAARRASAPTAASSWSATSTSTSQDELRRGHLFGPMPKEMRDDTAFHDRIHAYLPGWDVPKLDPSYFTRPLRLRQRLPRRVLEPAPPDLAARCHPGPARVGQPAQRPRSQGRQQHRQRAAQAAVAEPRDGGARRRPGLGGGARARAAPAGEGAAGVHRRRRVRQGRPELPRR